MLRDVLAFVSGRGPLYQTFEIIGGAIACYCIPILVALARGHRSTLAIAVLDILLGWTVIGWIAALVWACTGNVKAPWRESPRV